LCYECTLGPINPTRFTGADLVITEQQPLGQQQQQTEITGYAKLRNEQIAPRTGDEDFIPRFLSLACASTAQQQPLLQLLRANAQRFITAGAAVTTAAAPALCNTTAVTDISVKDTMTSSEYVNISPTCSTGSCSLRPRPLPPLLASAASIPMLSSDGKVLSGPGLTFLPSIQPSEEKFAPPPKKIMKLVGQAIKDWNMIEEGDRLLLGLSGGKDSLALLHILHALQVSI
jgi:hypothetical protein